MAEAPIETTTPPTGSDLYRAYLLDVDTDPDVPVVASVFKRGDAYPDTQKLIRAIIGGEGPKDEFLYLDAACTEVFVVAPADQPTPSWNLTLVRKQRSGKVGAGVDREWIKILLADASKTAEEKLELLARYT